MVPSPWQATIDGGGAQEPTDGADAIIGRYTPLRLRLAFICWTHIAELQQLELFPSRPTRIWRKMAPGSYTKLNRSSNLPTAPRKTITDVCLELQGNAWRQRALASRVARSAN
jgi:hypothetical protein